MNIAALTSLYPSPPRPQEGLFAERRWLGMRQRGHEVLVVHPVPHAPRLLARGTRGEYRRMPGGENRRGVDVARPRYLHLPGRALANARRFAEAGVELIAGRRPEVVIADYAWPAAAAAPMLAEAGIPFVICGRGSDVLAVREVPALRAALAEHLALAGHWCAVSRHLVEALDELGRRPGHGQLVPNGVDLQDFRIVNRLPARDSLGLAREGALVLVVGHLIERKDPLLALRAFARGAPPDAILAFIGRGPLEGAVRREARALGCEERVRLLGERVPAELREWYAASDLVLLTSSREGRPNVVLEALACGRPVVATAAGGTGELLEGQDGMLVDSRDPEALGARIAALLADPPPATELREAVTGLSWEAGLERLEACLQGALART